MLAWLIGLSSALAQVNVEPLTEYAKDDSWGFDLQAGFGLALGNAELLDVTAEGAVHWSKRLPDDKQPARRQARPEQSNDDDGEVDATTWFRQRFIAYGSYGFRMVGFGDDRQVVLNSGLVHVRYAHMVVPRVGVEVFGQVGNDAVLLLDWRVLGGGGIRFVPLESDRLRIWAGVGYMVEMEDRAETVEPEIVVNQRVTTYASLDFRLVPDRVDFLSTTYFQPKRDDLADIQLLEEAKIRFRVSESVAVGLLGRLRLDTRAPEGTVPVDIRVTNTLELHI